MPLTSCAWFCSSISTYLSGYCQCCHDQPEGIGRLTPSDILCHATSCVRRKYKSHCLICIGCTGLTRHTAVDLLSVASLSIVHAPLLAFDFLSLHRSQALQTRLRTVLSLSSGEDGCCVDMVPVRWCECRGRWPFKKGHWQNCFTRQCGVRVG